MQTWLPTPATQLDVCCARAKPTATCCPAGMVAETGDATERFLRSVARGEVDHKQELHQRAERGLQRINTLREWQDDCR